jgi:imidazolonepropionase
MHVDQFSNGGAQLAAELGAVTADHLEQTGPEGIEALADARVVPVLLPASVFCLGLKKYADARRMLDFGMPVVLATDFNPGSSPTPSLPFVMSLACTQMGMTPIEALRGCTMNAAKALGRGDIGMLAPGAKADAVVWDTDDLREIPYYVSAPLVWAVFKDGERVV